ncbi:MAG: SusD/RagB family nutrient-binding outer membrane lipoprotein [Bacteroidaceae bacterium]|nr:SusD/RagB family nutrient-binding outer membrane lipoprotein [Bacteroidaceae bacterium]
MKKHLLLLSASLFMAAGVSAQNVSDLNWDRDITEAQFDAAYASVEDLLGTSVSAQYALRGGKENGTPESHCYQYNYCLNCDNYAGYFVVTHYDFPYANAELKSTYALHEAFNGGARGQYTSVKNILIPLLRQSGMNDMPEVKAINLLYYCVAAQEGADISGPYSYLEDKQGVETPTTYNDLKTIYHGIVDDLDNIVACLKNYPNRPDWYQKKVNAIIDTYETGYNGITGKKFVETCWRLANSLKLRMAMRVVKVENEVAQKWAEEAVASGVVEKENQQSALFPSKTGFTHPLKQICSQWNDNHLNASFETIMAQLDHPYAKFFFEPNAYPITNKKTGEVLDEGARIVGMRAGVSNAAEGQTITTNPYVAASIFETEYGFMADAPLYFLKWAEVDLLRAEGAVRGWNMGGTAEEFYERAIRNACLDEPSYREWAAEDFEFYYDNVIDDYLKLEQAIPYTQVDPFGDAEDWVSPIKIGVKWNEADDNETKLEKIITQKWLALFPLSTEAWAELRRTGYPRIIPVLNAKEDGDGSLNDGDLIRRMPWVPTGEQDKLIVANSGIPALGGPDVQATRLWWDVNIGNFESAINDVKGSDANVYTNDGKVYVNGLRNGEAVSVYSTTGQLLGTATANGAMNINAKGLVIVKAGNASQKLIVK